MSLKPGAPEKVSNKYIFDKKSKNSLAGSMALAIEEEMATLYKTLKSADLPDFGVEDRLMLFTAIARGILRYLKDHQSELISEITFLNEAYVSHEVNDVKLNIDI